jgi:hypothetical protein
MIPLIAGFCWRNRHWGATRQPLRFGREFVRPGRGGEENFVAALANALPNRDEIMPSFTTVLRAAVMLVAAIILVKGWQLYGPSAGQLKSWTAHIAEQIHIALSDRPQLAPVASEPDSELQLAAAAPVSLPGVVAPPSRIEATEFAEVPPLTANSTEGPALGASNLVPAPPAATVESEMPTLLARLERLGAVDSQLAPWGSGGKLYRFCCRAVLADSRQHTRHFESVAAEPLAAVEQVVAKVEAWRVAQGTSSELR